MQRIIPLAAFVMLTAAAPGLAQDRKPVLRNGEVVIPSERTLEREAVTSPKNDFSTNDATATRQMERQNRQIDGEVEKGICTDC